MEPAVRHSKTQGLKKPNRASKSESFLAGSIGKSSKTSSESTLSRVYQTELAKFCPRRLFYIFLVAENDDCSALLLDNLMELNKNYEEVSSLTFITRDDVLALLDITGDYIFPNQLKPLLLNVIEAIKEQTTSDCPLILEAQLLKLKLIQVMYQQYVEQVKRNEKERNLELLLSTLSKECKRKQKKDEHKDEEEDKNKSPVKDTNKNAKKNKKDDKSKDIEKEDDIDYTSFPVDKDGISYEENIFNYISFYCIKGYYDADIIQNLIEQLNVPICAIVNISESANSILSPHEPLESFWKHIKQYFYQKTNQYKPLENTIIMHFSPSNAYDEKNTFVALEEFVLMLRRVVNIKLTYLQYLRRLKINKTQHSYAVMSVECMQQYKKSLRYIPSECISSEVILDAVLKEVCFNLGPKKKSETPSLRSIFLAKSLSKSVHCIDPLHDFDAFTNNSKRNTSTSSSSSTVMTSFLVHDKDILTTCLKSYKYIGSQVANTTLNLIKGIPVFCNLDNADSEDSIIHLHDIDPSTELQITMDEALEHLMYIFLFTKFTGTISPPLPIFHYELRNNVTSFDIRQYWNDVQPKFEGEVTDPDENIYDTPLVHFRWKENLNRAVLLQKVFETSNQFMYVDRKYSPETDDFLVVFSDKLDDFGINTKMFNVVIRTPICLRDFCRYSMVEEAPWLKENKIQIDETTFKIILNNICPGAQKVKTHLKMFQEYSYLLDENIKEETEDNVVENTSEREVNIEEDFIQGISFSDMLTDLESCPSSANTITKECENVTENKDMLTYDLGTNLFKLTGKITTFCSHDNVKVTVDNTGFLQLPDKCSFNVISGGNILTVHSSKSLVKGPYVVALRLKDDSRISFMTTKGKTKPDSNCINEVNNNQSDLTPAGPEIEKEIETVNYESSDSPQVAENSSEDGEETATNSAQVVHYVDEDYIKGVLEGKSLEEFSTNESYNDLLESLLKAKENNGTIYKVITTKSNYLERRNKHLKVPLENAFKNIIPFNSFLNKEPKSYQIYSKRFESKQDKKSDLEVTGPLEFRVCLPNGLFIMAHSCVVDKRFLMIKQEYTEEKPDETQVEHEEFRLFSNQGLVVIKKIDGTVTILKANGDMINFEKPNDGSGENNALNACHCSTLADYRNKLNKLLKDQENCDYTTSRRGHITSKQNYILDSKILKVLEQFDVPYIKKSVTKFDGKIIKIQGDKITQKQLHHVTSQQDFFTGEIFFERSDDFRSMFDRSGSQKCVFPDGTIISNSIDTAEELVDDFVYVTLSYKYEHPYYATVKYNFNKTAEIILNNDVVIKENVGSLGFTVKMEQELLVSVSDENIEVQKRCLECKSQFQTNFNIKPFKVGSWDPTAKFMHVEDSYEKHFYSDFVGNCSRSSNYIKGTTNSLKCNHFVKTNYKKLFVINKDLSGNMICTNDVVKLKIKKLQTLPNSSVDTYNSISNENITVVDCRRKFFVGYSNRFYNNSIDLCSQYQKSTSPKCELYTTFRVFHKMFQSVDDFAIHIANLQQAFFNDFLDNLGDCSVSNSIALLTSALEAYHSKYQQEALAEEKEASENKKKLLEEIEKKKLQTQCYCMKKKITMQEKMLIWRKECNNYRKKIKNKEVPVYFMSEFCQRVE